jgi:selenocysteine lyase/cysteine desulfurase
VKTFPRIRVLVERRAVEVRQTVDIGGKMRGHPIDDDANPGFVAAVDYLGSLGWDAVIAHERELGERFLRGLPECCRLHGLPTMEGRVPTFALTIDGLDPAAAARRLGERGFAVWHGNYYALEVMKRLGLENSGGAVRVGIVHYNTADEVDRLLDELAAL